MKRARPAQHEWALDESVRLALFVPRGAAIDNFEVQSGTRSVYYCPRAQTLIDGLEFALWALVGEQLDDDALAAYLHNSFLFAQERDDEESARPPDLRAAHDLVRRREDSLLRVTPERRPHYAASAKFREFTQAKVRVRLVCVTTRCHDVFGFLCTRFAPATEIVRGRNTHDEQHVPCVFFGVETSRPRGNKFGPLVDSLRLLGECDALALLEGQLRLRIDEFTLLIEREAREAAAEAKRRRAQQVDGADELFVVLDEAAIARRNAAAAAASGPPVQHQALAGTLYATIDASDARHASGVLVPGRFRLPLDVTPAQALAAYKAKPRPLEAPLVVLPDDARCVHYGSVRFTRRLAGGTGEALTGDSALKALMTRRPSLPVLAPPPAPAPAPPPAQEAPAAPVRLLRRSVTIDLGMLRRAMGSGVT